MTHRETPSKVTPLNSAWRGRSKTPKERRRLYIGIGCFLFTTSLAIFYTMGAWHAVCAFVDARTAAQETTYLKASVTVTAGAGAFTISAKESRVEEFEDATRVKLSAGAILEVDYTSDERVLRLRAGEIVVDVAKDPKRPLTVEADHFRATALGTKFKVSHSPSVQVHVYEGVVEVAAGPRGSDAYVTTLKVGESFPRKAQ